jgi:hypothetical protein
VVDRKRIIGKSGPSRVTRLGEFSHIERLFPLGSFLKNTELAKIFGYFFPQISLCINFGKKWHGLHFGRFFLKLIWSPWGQGGGRALGVADPKKPSNEPSES